MDSLTYNPEFMIFLIKNIYLFDLFYFNYF